jgi:hypothetical protein
VGQQDVDLVRAAVPGVADHVHDRLFQGQAEVEPAAFRHARPYRERLGLGPEPGNLAQVVGQLQVQGTLPGVRRLHHACPRDESPPCNHTWRILGEDGVKNRNGFFTGAAWDFDPGPAGGAVWAAATGPSS